MTLEEAFIPCTRAIAIGAGVFYRPIRSRHSGTHAAELAHWPWAHDGRVVAPRTVVHRAYWHESDPLFWVSAFLSYPYGMANRSEYFWEANHVDVEGPARFFGPRAEEEMELEISAFFAARHAFAGLGEEASDVP